MPNDDRATLAQMLAKRVQCQGTYDRTGTRYATCLVQDVEIWDGHEWHYIGHVWLQKSSSIRRIIPQRGDRVKFSAIVSDYCPPTGPREVKYGLMLPEDVEKVDPPTALPIPDTVSSALPPLRHLGPDPLAVLRDVASLVEKYGADRLRSIAAATQDGTVRAVADAAERLGNVDRLVEILEMLKA